MEELALAPKSKKDKKLFIQTNLTQRFSNCGHAVSIIIWVWLQENLESRCLM